MCAGNCSYLELDARSCLTATKLTLRILLVPTSAVGLLWNCLVIGILVQDKVRRTTTNILIGALSAVEVIVCAVLVPLFVATDMGRTLLPVAAIVVLMVLQILANFSMHLQSLIGYSRYKLVTQKFGQQKNRTKKVLLAAVVFLTFDLISVVLVRLLLGDLTWVVIMSIIFWGSIGLTFVLYLKTLRYVKKYSFALEAKRRRHARISMIMFKLFLSCVVEYIIATVVTLFSNDIDWIIDAFILFSRVNGCVRSFLYGSTVKPLRQVFVLKCISNRVGPIEHNSRTTDNKSSIFQIFGRTK